MNVLLVALNAKYIHSSLALRYLKSNCEVPDIRIELKEFTINEYTTDIMAQIYQQKPDILCFSCYIWNIEQILDICSDYKKISPNTIIILGGPEVSYDSQSILQSHNFLDIIVRGEGEITFNELLDCLSKKDNLSNVRGITYRKADKIEYCSDRELICDLDIINSPYSDMADINSKIVYYESSRGCPFNCTYCLSSTIKGVRAYSIERVKQDLNHLIDNNIELIKFVDRTFNYDEKRAKTIMQYIINKRGKTKFHFEIQAELLSEQMLKFLSQVPQDLFDFEIGIQSTYSKALEAINRNFNWEKVKKNIIELRKYNNIHLHLDLIAGLPYETYDYFSTSFDMVYNLEPDVIQLGFLKLLKGSKIRTDSLMHDYKYQSKPPYRILENKYLSYDNLLKLSNIEQLVDKYYNSGAFSQSLSTLVTNLYFNKPFMFYEDFSNFWEKNNLYNIGYKRENYYTFLLSFILDKHQNYGELFNDIIKLDFLINNKSYNLPEKLSRFNPEDINEELNTLVKQEKIDQKLIVEFGNSIRTIKKYLHLEYFIYNPITLDRFNKPTPILFEYDHIKKKAFKYTILENK